MKKLLIVVLLAASLTACSQSVPVEKLDADDIDWFGFEAADEVVSAALGDPIFQIGDVTLNYGMSLRTVSEILAEKSVIPFTLKPYSMIDMCAFEDNVSPEDFFTEAVLAGYDDVLDLDAIPDASGGFTDEDWYYDPDDGYYHQYDSDYVFAADEYDYYAALPAQLSVSLMIDDELGGILTFSNISGENVTAGEFALTSFESMPFKMLFDEDGFDYSLTDHPLYACIYHPLGIAYDYDMIELMGIYDDDEGSYIESQAFSRDELFEYMAASGLDTELETISIYNKDRRDGYTEHTTGYTTFLDIVRYRPLNEDHALCIIMEFGSMQDVYLPVSITTDVVSTK